MSGRRQLLIVEDDDVFARTLKRSFEKRAYAVRVASSREETKALLGDWQPGFAVFVLSLGNAAGLACVQMLRAVDPAMRIVVLTGFASIATAVEAIKLGASYYLAKPSNTDDIEAAIERTEDDVDAPLDARPSSIKTVEWEHIHQTLVEANFNISGRAAAGDASSHIGAEARETAGEIMRRLARFDLNLLQIFDAIHSKGGVSAAARWCA